MTRNTLFALIAGGMIAGWLINPVIAGKGRGGGRSAVPVLTQAETGDLLFMREEEKLAHDVYVALFDEWQLPVFSNIAGSEQRHMDAVLGLINRYGLEDPALGFGVFANAELQELYDNLVASGQKTELDALMAGALIEEVDMEDIVSAMERTDKADIRNVYANLLAGSENHLRAFVSNIEALTGEAYTAQWISQEEVDEILGR